jgi:hypothetical protein
MFPPFRCQMDVKWSLSSSLPGSGAKPFFVVKALNRALKLLLYIPIEVIKANSANLFDEAIFVRPLGWVLDD